MRHLLLTTLALSASVSAFAAAPSAEQIVAWVPADVREQGVSVENVVPVTLKGNEQAYLASVSYENAGRNFWAGYLLVRPTLKQARAVEEFGGQYNTIRPIDEYSPSQPFVIIGSSSSGQGTVQTSYAVVGFEDWQAKTLYTAEETDNGGDCGPDLGTVCAGNKVFINVFSGSANSTRIGLAITNVKYTAPAAENAPYEYSQESRLVFVDNPTK